MGQVGNMDSNISDARKVWIESPAVTVCGLYGPGTSQEITANWEQPFENLTIGNLAGHAGGYVQAEKGMTSMTSFNTQQIWSSNRPTAFTVELKLYALSDPDLEVMKPLAALEYMIAPDTRDSWGGGGKIAEAVQLNIGRIVIYQYLVIDSISIPFDKEVDSKGRFVRCTVNVQLSTTTMVTREMLANGYGMQRKF